MGPALTPICNSPRRAPSSWPPSQRPTSPSGMTLHPGGRATPSSPRYITSEMRLRGAPRPGTRSADSRTAQSPPVPLSSPLCFTCRQEGCAGVKGGACPWPPVFWRCESSTPVPGLDHQGPALTLAGTCVIPRGPPHWPLHSPIEALTRLTTSSFQFPHSTSLSPSLTIDTVML